MENQNFYPIQYIEPVKLSDGNIIQLRPIHPADGQKALSFKDKLSTDSLYNRFLGQAPKITEKLVKRMTILDYSQEMAIVAEAPKQDTKEKEIVAVARLAKVQEYEAEFAIIITDAWQGKGLGLIMTNHMIDIAKDMGFQKVSAWFFSHNSKMADIFIEKGFVIKQLEQGMDYAELLL